MRNVWCIGNGTDGQFGIGDAKKCTELTKCKWSDDIQIKNIFPSRNYTIFEDIQGNYYSCGYNAQNQCTLEDKTKSILNITPITWFSKNNIKISQCFPGNMEVVDNSPFWKSEDGKIYASGSDNGGRLGIKTAYKSIVNEIPFLTDLSIKKIVTGGYVSIAITNDFKVYSSGDDEYGTNGHGQKGINNKTWKMVDSLRNIDIIDVSMSDNFAVFLSKSGQVYSCGRNDFAQLGLGVKEERDDFILRIPTRIDYFNENKVIIKAVACGDKHCIALDITGKVYTWGKQYFNPQYLKPELITDLKEVADEILVGADHSIIKTNKNNYFAFGSNVYGVCCHDGSSTATLICINEWILQRINGNILAIVVGNDVTFILTSSQMCDDEKKDASNDIQIMPIVNEERKHNLSFVEQKEEKLVEEYGMVVVTDDKQDFKENTEPILDGPSKQFYNFLLDIQMEKYYDKFKENDCCYIGDIEYIDDDILMNEIGIKHKLKRRKFIGAAQKLKKEMDGFHEITKQFKISIVIMKRLQKYGIVTVNILCNEVNQKIDLENKLEIKQESQCDLLWNMIQTQLDPQHNIESNNNNNIQYQNEGVQIQTPYI